MTPARHLKFLTLARVALIGLAGLGNGAFNSSALAVPVNHAPLVATGGPYIGFIGQAVSLDGSGSFDPDQGDNITFGWDLDNDGIYSDSTLAKPTVTFSAPGSDPVCLRVTDSFGASSFGCTTVSIVDRAPIASSGGPYSAFIGQSIVFDATGSFDPDPGDHVSFAWDLSGSGTFSDSTLANPDYSFGLPGSDTVCVRVTDDFGMSNVSCSVVSVFDRGPIASPGGPYLGRAGTALVLSGSGFDPDPGDSLTYAWDLDNDGLFGDSTLANPVVTFADPGTESICLRVTDRFGATDTRCTIAEIGRRLVNDVPEPGSSALVALALACAGLSRRRKS